MHHFVLGVWQASIGFTALLAVFPLCLAQQGGRKKDKMPDPLLRGSVCPVRDSLDFLHVSELAYLRFREQFYQTDSTAVSTRTDCCVHKTGMSTGRRPSQPVFE